MKYTLLLFLCLSICACTKTKKETIPTKPFSAYFEFDNVEHYYFEFPEAQFFKMISKENHKKKSADDLRLLEIVMDGNDSVTLNDKAFFNDLKRLKTSGNNISAQNINTLKSIFKEKKFGEYYIYSCVSFYRDILVFKKGAKITGIAKLCFGCGAYQIIGTRCDTESFCKADNDWSKLDKILHPKNP